MRKVLLTIVIVVLVEVIAWIIFVFSGAYNVSTSNHDNGFINWWLATGASRSVRQHASRVKPVPSLDDPAKVQEGFKHYNEMCVECHGAPGKPAGEIAKGLWPAAPDLSRSATHWKPAQLFWITKNGIKFSAMPGWGATHSDEKLWAVTAFLEKLPKLSAADYHEMETNTIPAGAHGEHSPDEHH